jgi:ATP adenylyltransferase|uniref:HIT domain-containing protein n=1 Tax=candidate division WOR-3 bacterium TaxID=2052148 RepID=A0A7V3PUI8_UNCW3
MEKLWAPWRADYIIKNADCQKKRCLFCVLKKRTADKPNLILHRGKYALVVMNRFPYNSGHLMVAPLRHTAALETLRPAESAELWKLLQRCVKILKKEYHPQGFNIGANLGAVAGAGVTGHLHLHIVPRWQGDTNFMPVLGETKVVSEHLLTTYDRLRPHFSASTRRK